MSPPGPRPARTPKRKPAKRAPLKFGEIDPVVEGQSVCMVCRASPIERCICGGPAADKTKREPARTSFDRVLPGMPPAVKLSA